MIVNIFSKLGLPLLLRKHRLVYDYQFVRNGAVAKETRTLVEEYGVKKNLQNADLLTRSFRYENVLFGPATLLDDRNSGRYDFAAEAKTEVDGRPAVVISARPKEEAGVKPLPFGRMWVSPQDGAVLKIEWDEPSLGHYSALEERAKKRKCRRDPILLLERQSMETFRDGFQVVL